MDRTEQLVAEYLSHQGIQSVVYEPDGNMPPDFVIDGRIAVEVRRLNQNEETEAGPRGLEEIRIPLSQRIERFVETLGPLGSGESWFVSHTIRRPVPPWKRIETFLRERLTVFSGQASRRETEYVLDRGFRVRLFRASKPHPTFFLLGGSSDRDSGGFVLAEMVRNIRICVEDKVAKVAELRSRYPEWWLVLVDHIGYGLSSADQDELRALVELSAGWDRIVLVNPDNTRQGFELGLAHDKARRMRDTGV